MKCSIRIPDNLGQQVSDTCQTRSLSTSELIRLSLEAYLGDSGAGELITQQSTLDNDSTHSSRDRVAKTSEIRPTSAAA